MTQPKFDATYIVSSYEEKSEVPHPSILVLFKIAELD
jgi:hypothetical protein